MQLEVIQRSQETRCVNLIQNLAMLNSIVHCEQITGLISIIFFLN